MTEYYGGRAKLGAGKFRMFGAWRGCLCHGNTHVSPPENQKELLDEEGKPKEELKWDPLCPVACKEFHDQFEEAEGRTYPKWSEKTHKFVNMNIGNVFEAANAWMELQGAGTEGGYDSNSGRKSLARWLDHLSVSYRWGFEIHGDLEDVWRGNYQPLLPKSGYKKRDQSKDPNEALQAHRRLAKWMGRGCERKLKYKLDVNARLTYELLKAMGKKEMADRILQGLPADEEDEEFMNEEEEEEDDELNFEE